MHPGLLGNLVPQGVQTNSTAHKEPIMDHKLTLGKAERLKSRKLIERIFREGQRIALFPFRVYYFVSSSPVGVSGSASQQSTAGTLMPVGGASVGSTPVAPMSGGRITRLQAGFGAGSRNFKKAVDRNRIKRLTREAYRLQKQELYDHLAGKGLFMAVFFIYTGKELPDYGTVTEKIGVALQKLVKATAS
jgi:ribonuclease P protein component